MENNENLENKTLCLWKNVALNDEQKMKENNTCVTFSVDKYCFKCNGEDESCNNYIPVKVYYKK